MRGCAVINAAAILNAYCAHVYTLTLIRLIYLPYAANVRISRQFWASWMEGWNCKGLTSCKILIIHGHDLWTACSGDKTDELLILYSQTFMVIHLKKTQNCGNVRACSSIIRVFNCQRKERFPCKKQNQHEKNLCRKIWNWETIASHLEGSSPVPAGVSQVPRPSLALCSGARQPNQRRLGYRQEYWFHYSALTPPTYLTNVRAASHLLSLQGCCRHTRRAANRRNKKRREKARVLACPLTHTTPEMLTKTLYHTQSAAFTDTCHPSQLSHSVSRLYTLIPPSIFSSHVFPVCTRSVIPLPHTLLSVSCV